MDSIKDNSSNEITDSNTHKSNILLYPFLCIGSLAYAIFYTFCLYRNSSGITYPFFAGGTLLFFFLCLKKYGITAKKNTLFYVIGIILLGISTCLTDSMNLHFMNKLGILTIMFFLFLDTFYNVKSWNLPKYIHSFFKTIFTSSLFLFRPFTDYNAYREQISYSNESKSGKLHYVLIGCVIAFPLSLVVIILLGWADAVFASLFNRLFKNILDLDIIESFWEITLLMLFSFFGAYCIFSRLINRNISEALDNKRVKEPVIAITFSGLLSFIYLIFCIIQFKYLFMGYGTLPAEYTYAEYARQGFFQLVFVCLINLTLVLICLTYFRKNNILKGILTFISVCTYIMIASSIYRMLLYIKVYHLTFLRVFVLWALLVILLWMTGLFIMIYKESFPLFRYSLTIITILYLMLTFARPDYWIADYNVRHMAANTQDMDGNKGDWSYLGQLSLDAAPVIILNADEMHYSDTSWYQYYTSRAERLYEEMSPRTFNFSRYTAYRKLPDSSKIF